VATALDAANQKIKDLENKLRAATASEGALTLLPNGDLHRGLRMEDANQPNIEAEVVSLEQSNPLNRIMAEILLAAKGGHNLTCTRCGLQWDGQNAERDIREHLKKDHSSLVNGWNTHGQATAEILMANLEEAKQRLAEAQ
jgi:hypothetical protein